MARKTYDRSGSGLQKPGNGKSRGNGKGSSQTNARKNGKASTRANARSNGKGSSRALTRGNANSSGKVSARANARSNGKGSSQLNGRGNAKGSGRVNGRCNGNPRPASATPRPIGSAVPCVECGLCCAYVAIDIDHPLTVKRATEALWFLYHEHVSLFFDGDDWTLQFETPCRQQREDNRCRIYPSRPHICRELSSRSCEVNSPHEGEYFNAPEAFLDFLREKRPKVYDTLQREGYLPETKRLSRRAPVRRERCCFIDRYRQMRSVRLQPRVQPRVQSRGRC